MLSRNVLLVTSMAQRMLGRGRGGAGAGGGGLYPADKLADLIGLGLTGLHTAIKK